MERCDTISNESGEKAMSFDRFVTFSLENNIFSEEKFKVKQYSHFLEIFEKCRSKWSNQGFKWPQRTLE